MDQTNCTFPFATDRILERTTIGTCDISLFSYWGTTFTIVVVRLCCVISKYLRHLKRKKMNLSTSAIDSFMGLSVVFLYLQFSLIAGLNIGNVDNGFSFSVLLIPYFAYAAQLLLEFHRLVKLGTRIGASTLDVERSMNIEKLDIIGKAVAFLATTFLGISTLILIILSPIFPQHEILLGTLGFAFKTPFQITLTFGIIWQIQRCYSVISKKNAKFRKKIKSFKKIENRSN